MNLTQLKELADKFNRFLKGDKSLYDEVNKLSASEIKELKNNYKGEAEKGKPVNLLRFILLCILESETLLNSEVVDQVKSNLEKKNIDPYADFLNKKSIENFEEYPIKSKSFFSNWKNHGSILFPFVYRQSQRNSVLEELKSQAEEAVKDLRLKNQSMHIIDFYGPNNYGAGRVWVAIYPKDIGDHRKAYQLFFSINHNGLRAGIGKGHKLPGKRYDDTEVLASYDKLIPHLSSKIDEWKKLNSDIQKEIEQSQGDIPTEQVSVPLNQIFYGPPGTGKTYNTISEAVKIVEELSDIEFADEYGDRKKLKEAFEKYVNTGQIAFSTFHQSMSYEDFIEGIKPQTIETGTGDNKHVTVTYDIQDGIFKKLCKNAEGYLSTKKSLESTDESDIKRENFSEGVFYKMSLGQANNEEDQDIYDYCIKNNKIALGWGEDVDFTKTKDETQLKELANKNNLTRSDIQFMKHFRLYMKPGNYVAISKGNKRLRAIGKVIGDYIFDDHSPIEYNHFREVKWIIKDVDISANEFYEGNIDMKTIYPLDTSLIKQSFFEQFKTQKEKAPDFIRKNFVLVIDEINRGNVSQIFGELITLLEEDKRKGNKEFLEVELPYSQSLFGVPNNLYILGTMNTADRSVEALDTALRRRFMFKEMLPISDLLSPQLAIYNLWYEAEGMTDSEYNLKESSLYSFIGVDEDTNRDNKIWESFEEDREYEIYEIEEVMDPTKIPINGVNLKKMLEVINYRIEKLLDRDHTIGHSYFLNVYNSSRPSIALKQTFKKNILPLLQEYFYGDYGKIGMILGEAFVKVTDRKETFANFKHIDSDLQADYKARLIYEIVDIDSLEKKDFIGIYE